MSDVNVSMDRNNFANNNNEGELNEPPHLKKSISYIDLTAPLVTQYLDAHPEFLNEYLRKSQIQRRISVLNDKNSGSILEKLRIQTHFNDLNPENSNNLTVPGTIKHSSAIDVVTLSNGFSKSKKNSAPHVNTEVERQNKFSLPIELTTALSEPNLPPPKEFIFNTLFDRVQQKEKRDQIGKARREFKQLSINEKMFTVVKTLYESLDMKTTCKKILNTVSLLLDADRCSLFLVIDDDASENKKFLISVVFDAQSANSIQQSCLKNEDAEVIEEAQEQIRIPYGKGIAGYVASTGQAVNIPDAYQDPRFNSTVDTITGYKTKSILCLPILNENGQCIAVAEAINKSNDLYEDENNVDERQFDLTDESPAFNKQDEEIFAKFMPFISIAIRNSNLYAQSWKEAQTNKVLLELATIVFDESSTTVDNLVSRILSNTLQLLECERCQVILLNNSINNNNTRRLSITSVSRIIDRVYELNNSTELPYNVSVQPSDQTNMHSPVELDIINSVIDSGKILNIQSIKDHEKYSKLHKTNKSTSSLLCIPVINSLDKVVALIYATNKTNNSAFNFFSESDINVAQAFALFCGIGIQNIMMYEKVVSALNMQQVALDVLSYHVSSTQDELQMLVKEQILNPIEYGLNDFGFDENTLDDMNTLKCCISMFGELGFIEKFNIPYEILCRFFLTVKKNYRPVAYHNWRHGFNVMSTMYGIMTTGKYNNSFSDLEIFALLIACICHDLDHRGTTNNFQIKIQSPLAKLYTTSTMEHHHFNQCIVILHNNMNNILMNLTQSQHSTVIEIIEKAILATDLALHFKHVDKFLEKAESSNTLFETNEEKDLLMNMLMTASDLSGGTKYWNCHYRLSKQVSSEFFNEGDLEKEKFKKEPIDSMNRNKAEKLPKIQIQFLQSVCVPLYKGLSQCNKNLEPMISGCNSNLQKWQKIIDEDNSSEIT